jgi:hypothetical protein
MNGPSFYPCACLKEMAKHYERNAKMDKENQPQPPVQLGNHAADPMPMATSFGFVIAVITLIVCSMEMVPGWGAFNLGWDRATYYLIVGVAGALAGSLIAERRLLGMAGGALALIGSLFCTALVLENVQQVPKVVLVLAGGIGALPGVGLYFAVTGVLKKMGKANDDRVHSRNEVM